jgi:hypothetical protein
LKPHIIQLIHTKFEDHITSTFLDIEFLQVNQRF